jgi:hypothetical protein
LSTFHLKLDRADDSIGEESVAAGEKEELTDEFTWIVDPIDVCTFLLTCWSEADDKGTMK